MVFFGAGNDIFQPEAPEAFGYGRFILFVKRFLLFLVSENVADIFDDIFYDILVESSLNQLVSLKAAKLVT